ncbi:MAG: response regulator [Methanomicrobiales archaeon]
MISASILVVEEEVIVAENLRVTLSGMGYHVTKTACSSSEALDSVEKNQPDLILMDIALESSEFDGVETARRIRKNHDIPVVFVTAYADDETLERVKATEPFAYVLKPFNERELYSVIELALHRHLMEQEIKKRDTILYAISFAVKWFLHYQRESCQAKAGQAEILEKGILEILEHIGLAVDANTVAIFKMNSEFDPRGESNIQHIWIAPGIAHILAQPSNDSTPVTFTSSLLRTLLIRENVIAGDIGKFPEEERKFFDKCGISSLAMHPLFKDDTLWGFITLSSGVPRLWSDGEMEALLMAGNIIGAILE